MPDFETVKIRTFYHGGRREGAGRKPTGHNTYSVRLSREHKDLLKTLGSSEFLRKQLDAILEGKIPILVDTSRFTDEEKNRFVKGWEQAGGPADDAESSAPWFAPWCWQSEITVHGIRPEEWGADWFRQCRAEIEAIRAEDEEEDEE